MKDLIAAHPEAAARVIQALMLLLVAAWGVIWGLLSRRLTRLEADFREMKKDITAVERLADMIPRIEKLVREQSREFLDAVSAQTMATHRLAETTVRLDESLGGVKGDIRTLQIHSHEHGNAISECAGKLKLLTVGK